MRSRSQILKWGCYVLALFVCAALQTTPGLFQLGQAKPLFILPLCLAVAVYEGEFAGALFGAVCGLLWDYTAGRTVGMLTRTPRGRCVTRLAYEHLHMAVPKRFDDEDSGQTSMF